MRVAIAEAATHLAALRTAIGQAMVGQSAVIEQVLVALVASGHVLIEGVPGLGKTLLVRALAQALSLPHARVQFTPDMMPSDITGHAVLDPATRELRVVRGPGLHARAAGRRDQPRAGQDAERAARSDAGVSGDARRPDAAAAASRSWCWRRRIRSRPKAPIRCRKRSSIASCSRSRSAIRRAAEEVARGGARDRPNQAGDELPLADVKPVPRRGRCRDAAAARRASARRRAGDRLRRAHRARDARLCRASRSAAARAARWRWCAARARSRCSTAATIVTPDDIKRVALPALRHRVALAPDALLEGPHRQRPADGRDRTRSPRRAS